MSTDQRDHARDRRLGDLAAHPAVRRISAVVLLVGLALASFHPQVFGPALFPWDWVGRMSTGPSFVSAVIATGEWPVWVPFQGSGAPMAPDIGSGLYYPVHWLTGIAGIPLTADLQATLQVLHVAAGGLGMVALSRERGVRWAWAVPAGAAFLFFGGFSGQATHMHHVRGFAMFPWLLWSVTEPFGRGRWRLALVPVLAWLIAAGAYPGQLPIFAAAAAGYLGVELWRARRDVTSRDLLLLGLAGATAGLAVAAVLWPFLAADAAGLLHRPVEPTVEARARGAVGLSDVIGLHLDRWTTHGRGAEVRSWSVGVPVLVGLAALRRRDLVRHLPVLTAGAVGSAFMLLPLFSPFQGTLLAVHPSRFPFADAKVTVAAVLVLGGALGWSNLARAPRPVRLRAGAMTVLLALGAWAARTQAPTGRITDEPWLLVAILLATAAVALWSPRARVLVVLVGLLVVVDGQRIMHDQDFTDRPSPVSPWEAQLPADELAQREDAVRALPEVLTSPPATRPARTPPAVPPEERASGHPRDALGFLGLSHNMTAYGGFVTDARWEAVNDPDLAVLLAQPWTAWTVPCDAACRASGELPPPSRWETTSQLHTTRYGMDRIDYVASFEEEVVVVENEINHPGWSSPSPAVRLLEHDGHLRTWVVAPGEHHWSATYTPPEATTQKALAASAAIGLLVTGLYARRRQTSGRED